MGTLLVPRNTTSGGFLTPSAVLTVAKVHPVIRGASIAYDLWNLYRGSSRPTTVPSPRVLPPTPPAAAGTQSLPARVRGELTSVSVPRVSAPPAPAVSGGLLQVLAQSSESTVTALVEGLNAHAVTTFSGLEMVAQQLESIMLVLANTLPALSENQEHFAKMGAVANYLMTEQNLADMDGNQLAKLSPLAARAMADITTAAGNTDANDGSDIFERMSDMMFGDSEVIIPLPQLDGMHKELGA